MHLEKHHFISDFESFLVRFLQCFLLSMYDLCLFIKNPTEAGLLFVFRLNNPGVLDFRGN